MALYFCSDNIVLKASNLGAGTIFLLYLLTSYRNGTEQGSKALKKNKLDCCSATEL